MNTEQSSDLRKKRWVKTLQFLAAYLVAAWTFLQFVDWTLNRYQISPYWVDLLLWIFIGIIPSVLVYFYHRERINKRQLHKREKILFPLNLILIMVVTYFGFGSSDLGATTKKINYTDEMGNPQSKTITKEEFRIGIPIYGFENTKNNDSLSWWRYGIGSLLVYDLEQNKSLSPYAYFFTDTSTKITEASTFSNFYVDGDYEKNGTEITINVYVRKANNAKVLHKQSFTGDKFLDLLDEISYFITEKAGFIETNNVKYLDYPLSEFMSDSEEAMREFVYGDYDEAVAIDSTFAIAYLEEAKRNLRFNTGTLEVQDIINKAYKFRNKLPLQKQLEVNIQRNLAFGDIEGAKNLIKLQLEVDPTNSFYNNVLLSLYGKRKDLDQYFKHSSDLFDKDPKPINGVNLANAAMVSGQHNLLITEISKYELINPEIRYFKIQPYIFLENFKEARTIVNDLKSLNPSYNNRTQVYDSAIIYLENNPFDSDLLDQFEGFYRAARNEQTQNVWRENNRLLVYTNNQFITPMNLGGSNSIVGGFVNDRTWRFELVKDSLEKVVGYWNYQFDYNVTNSFWNWKEDKYIQSAHERFTSGNYTEALKLYKTALRENPKHEYLKNFIKHIEYTKNTPKELLSSQNKKFSGTYGPRKFYIENDKFYYKRKSENLDLPRVQLLAINDSSYMDLTRFNTIMTFVTDSSGVLASDGLNFNAQEGQFIWERLPESDNYFLKDE